MITLNLLPDVKKEFLQAKRTKGMLTTIAVGVSLASIAAVTLMAIYIFGVQKVLITTKQSSIDNKIATIQQTADLDKVITVQNQLNALPGLYDQTVASNRIFGFLTVLTPNKVKLSSVTTDFDDYTMEIKGTGEDVKSVNTFIDTLKLATYTSGEDNDAVIAFKDVVLDALGTETNESSFSIILSYDPSIFDPNVEGLKLTVPSITSTRSQTEKPKSLFDSSETEQQ